MDNKQNWLYSKENLISTILSLGFQKELGEVIAKNLGSPKAMDRMRSYLENVKPTKEELVVDEMLAIMSDIEVWRAKKESEAANAAYTEYLNSDFRE